MKIRTMWVVAAVAVLAALLAVGIVPRVQRNAKVAAEARNPASLIPAVSVVAPRRLDAPPELSLPGGIQAIQETPIYARTNGYLRMRLVEIGQLVTAGQLLAEIDTPELDQELVQAGAALAQAQAALSQSAAGLEQARATHQQALASLEQSKAALQFARVSAERWSALVQRDLVARQDGDEKQTAWDTARATTDAARANADAARANIGAMEANVASARANVAVNEANLQRLTALQNFRQIRAPYAGVITAWSVDRGALITSGSGNTTSPLFRIAQIDTLRIFVNVPQTFVRSIRAGQETQIVLQEFPGRTFRGRVASTAGALDPASRTLLAEVRLPNADRALLPGMYAQVRFSVALPEPPWLIPATALIVREGAPQVAVVRPDGTVRYQKVDVGRDLGSSVEILSGLDGTERLVVNVPDSLREGAPVRSQRT